MRNVIIDRSEGYTIVGNHQFNDHSLSLKAMGLLTLLISLPNSWDFSMKGIAAICKDGVDSVCAALTELEKAGYVQRHRVRDKYGRLRKIELTIFERPPHAVQAPSKKSTGEAKSSPIEPEQDAPKTATPIVEEPMVDDPVVADPNKVEPDQDYPVLENTSQIKTQEENKQKENTHESITHSINQQPAAELTDGNEIRERIKKQIEFSCMAQRYRRDQLNEIVEIMVEVAMNRSPVIRIGKDCEYATAFVQKRFSLINALHIEHIMEGLRENCTFVRNPKAYLMKTIFNSVTTIENSCALQHNHEFGSSW